MVSVSPRLRDSLDYEEPEATDPRFSFGFRSLSLESTGYEEYEPHNQYERRPYSANGDPAATRKKRRQRQSDLAFEKLAPFQYRTVADGELFRLAVVLPGTGSAPIECQLHWESAKKPRRDYRCLSYCWETIEREADIICDGFRFPVTKNLLYALRNLRKPTSNLLIWIDQICINQEDDQERGHQVSIMKNIFNQAKEVIVWLGEEDDKARKLFEYARKMDNVRASTKKSALKRVLNARQLQDAIMKLLKRNWFERVWVIPEVALARFVVVACGQDRISWDNLVRLMRDVELPESTNFDKQVNLLGNPRQRIAILTQMVASQRAGRAHTDLTQLLILAKGSKATDVRDLVYAFYGVTLLTTFPDYTRPVEMLYADIVHMYINSIKWETSYSTWHNLTEKQRTHQLMSILYSAGALHQHYDLPSWIPDWTFAWHLAPLWCKTTSNIVTGTGKDEWSAGVRSDYRAGGNERGEFDIIDGPYGMHKLRISVFMFATISNVSETTPASTPGLDAESVVSPDAVGSATLRYGRACFQTNEGHVGVATPGVDTGDKVAIILGGDVPVVLRPDGHHDEKSRAYKLLCECFVQNDAIMQGGLARTNYTRAEDIVLI